MVICTTCGEQSPEGDTFCPSCGSYLAWHGQRVDPAGPGPGVRTLARPRPASPPAAVRPGVVKAPPRRTASALPEPEVAPGGPVCRQCHQPNAPDRRFCRRCGTWLEEIVAVAVPPPLPWWRRWWNWVVGRLAPVPANYRAGERPARRRSTNIVRRNLGRVAMVAVLLVILVPPLRTRVADAARSPYDALRRALTHPYTPVRPIEMTATSSAPDHPPQLAADRLSNTYWAEGAEGEGEGEVITFAFPAPVDLDRVIITSGASGSEEAFLSHPRPRVLHVVFDSGGSDEIVLEDVPTPQSFKLKAEQVTSVEFSITLAHSSAEEQDCSISEFEFFTRS